jgi:hypothetical protein
MFSTCRFSILSVIKNHYQPINVPNAGAQTFFMDYT